MTIPEQAVEAAAEKIYYLLPYNETHPLVKPPWVPGGNSFKQDEARHYARAALTAAQPLMGVQRPEDVARRREEIARALWESQRARIKDQNGLNARLTWKSDGAPWQFWHQYELDADAVLALPHTGQPPSAHDNILYSSPPAVASLKQWLAGQPQEGETQ